MKIGITGADGFLGYHLRTFLHSRGGHEIRLANRATFASPAALDSFVRDLDGLAHFAGMNRGENESVEKTNVMLASDLVAALRRTGARPTLVYANSTHVERDTAYGRGKRVAAELMAAWATGTGAVVANFVLPNVFGEFGRPFYNSVVATFCHQLANGERPEIQVDAVLELLHAQEIARSFADALVQGNGGTIRLPGKQIRVSETLDRLQALHMDYTVAKVIPNLSDPLDMALFNTLRSSLYPIHYPVGVELRTDPRGSLFEAVKTRHGGQAFFSSTHPGVTRGNHYHLHKVERFLVVSGEAEICLRRLFSNDVKTFQVGGATPCYVDMPTFHTHSIKNVGRNDLWTLFWSSEIFDPANPDTYAEAVSP